MVQSVDSEEYLRTITECPFKGVSIGAVTEPEYAVNS